MEENGWPLDILYVEGNGEEREQLSRSFSFARVSRPADDYDWSWWSHSSISQEIFENLEYRVYQEIGKI